MLLGKIGSDVSEAASASVHRNMEPCSIRMQPSGVEKRLLYTISC